MAGTRALFASIGAGAALVAAAALSLLAVSAVLAFGGWSSFVSPGEAQPALVFAGSPLQDAGTAQEISVSTGAAPIAAPRPGRRAARRGDRPSAAAGSRAVGTTEPTATSAGPRGATAVPALGAPAARPTADPARAPAATAAPRKSGDHVRKVGESLSSTVQNAGTVLAQATQPLAPPVSVAIQQVLNAVADVVQRSTDGLGNTLDTLLPPKPAR